MINLILLVTTNPTFILHQDSLKSTSNCGCPQNNLRENITVRWAIITYGSHTFVCEWSQSRVTMGFVIRGKLSPRVQVWYLGFCLPQWGDVDVHVFFLTDYISFSTDKSFSNRHMCLSSFNESICIWIPSLYILKFSNFLLFSRS